MSFFNRKQQPADFEDDETLEDDEEEYYGEDEETGEYYEDEEGYEEEDEEDDEAAAPAGNVGMFRTVIMFVGGIAVLGALAFAAVNTFAPETLNELVNNLPFVAKAEEDFADEAPVDAAAAPPPGDVTAAGDVGTVPPAPPGGGDAAPEPNLPVVEPRQAAPDPAAVGEAPAPAPRPKPKPKPKPQPKPQPRAAAARPAAAPQRQAYTAQPVAPQRTWAAAPAKRYAPAPVTPAPAARRTRYAVQVGSFSYADNATALVNQLRAQGVPAYVAGGNSPSPSGYVVRSVGVAKNHNVQRLLAQYRAIGYPGRLVSIGNGLMAVQVGVYPDGRVARSVSRFLNNHGVQTTVAYARGVTPYRPGGLARVWVGSYGTQAQAAARARQLQRLGVSATVTAY